MKAKIDEIQKFQNKRYAIAVDFDGVLHSYISGWTGPIPFDPPVEGAIEAFHQLKTMPDTTIIIFSARAKDDLGSVGIRQWLVHHGFIDNDEEIKITANKWETHADLFIDDRSFRFEGNWNEVIKYTQDINPRLENWQGGEYR